MGYISAATDKDHVRVWERQGNKRVTRIFPAPAEFYIKDSRGTFTSIMGDKLRKLTFKNLRDMRQQRDWYRNNDESLFESDVNPSIKVLSENYYGVGGERINVTFLDIENDYDPQIGYADISNPYAPINSVALYHQWTDKAIVLAVPPPGFDKSTFDESLRQLGDIRFYDTESDLLLDLLEEIQDADALCGWNSNLFDFPYIAKRIEKVLGPKALRRLSFPDAPPPRWREQEVFNRKHEVVEAGGRILADYMLLYKKFEFGERESYKLEAIAEAHLPELPKLTYDGSLAQLYHKDFNHFVRYNLRDTEILKGFERVLGYMELAVIVFRESTGLYNNVTGTVRLADYAILNFCHHVLNVQLPDIVNNSDITVKLKGAFVLNPIPGMHEMVGSVDVSSLYPSCIRSINISPETLIGQFTGTWDDVPEIAAKTDKKLTFIDQATGDSFTETAATWNQLFDQNNCAISGYGTVFSMSTQGVIPAILERWHTARIQVNKDIDQINDDITSITARYTAN